MRRILTAVGVVLGLFVALVVLTVMLPEDLNTVANSVTNSRPAGAQALGQVLINDGVKVTQETRLEAAAAAPAGSTLAVVLRGELNTSAISALRSSPADLVVIYDGEQSSDTVPKLTDNRVYTSAWWADSVKLAAGCSDPDALAAGTINGTAMRYGLNPVGSQITSCFTESGDGALYADLKTDAHRVTVVSGNAWIQNKTIAEQGHAALALRTFGRHDRLIWYLPGADATNPDAVQDSQLDMFSLLPPWSRPVFAVLIAAAAAAALWRGRRFGRLVKESMPVELPASEASTGLAGLYRQSGARGHAAAALRAASIKRVSARLGLPTSAPPETVVTRLAQSSGANPSALADLLYGAAPATDQHLADLAAALTELDRKLSSR